METPAAEVHVDARVVRALLEEQHRDLAALPLVALDAGWDNTLWRVGDELLARLPRRRAAVDLMRNEQRWLPALAPRLPLPVSAPVRIGEPSDAYPWPWSIVPWLTGTPADHTEITRPTIVAEQLGAFLRALHRPAPAAAPHNPYRGVPLVDRTDTFEQRVTQLDAELDARAVREVWHQACRAPAWSGPPMWIHGDLHPGNMLIADGALSAIVDFGDLCAGDPATDLAAAWLLLPESEIRAFARAYGGIDAALEARAVGWTVLFGTILLAIGLRDRPAYAPIGRRGLDTALAHVGDRL